MPRNRVLPCSRSRWNAGTTSFSTCCTLRVSPPPAVLIALCRWKMSTRSIRSRHRLASRDSATAERMRLKSAAGSRTLVPTIALSGFKVRSTRPRFFSDSPLPVLHGGVEVVHPDLKRARHCPVLLRRCPAHHQSADSAATEAEQRNLHTRAAECAHFHGNPPLQTSKPTATANRCVLGWPAPCRWGTLARRPRMASITGIASHPGGNRRQQ